MLCLKTAIWAHKEQLVQTSFTHSTYHRPITTTQSNLELLTKFNTHASYHRPTTTAKHIVKLVTKWYHAFHFPLIHRHHTKQPVTGDLGPGG